MPRATRMCESLSDIRVLRDIHTSVCEEQRKTGCFTSRRSYVKSHSGITGGIVTYYVLAIDGKLWKIDEEEENFAIDWDKFNFPEWIFDSDYAINATRETLVVAKGSKFYTYIYFYCGKINRNNE